MNTKEIFFLKSGDREVAEEVVYPRLREAEEALFQELKPVAGELG
jgi:hypothetical protein